MDLLKILGGLSLNKHQRQRIADAEKLLENRNRDVTERDQEIADLKSRLQELTRENTSLRQSLHVAQPSKQAPIPKEQIGILLFLFNGCRVDEEQIGRAINVSWGLAKYHVEELSDKHLVYANYNVYDPTTYSISQEGRSLVVKNGWNEILERSTNE